LENIKIVFIFAGNKPRCVMKEKKEDVPTEHLAAEPIAAKAMDYENEQLYGIDKWPGMPLVGPANVEEANARIDEAEREIASGEVYDWNRVMLDAVDVVNHYANRVY